MAEKKKIHVSMTIGYIVTIAIIMWKPTWRKHANRSCKCDSCMTKQPIMLFFAKFENNKFDEASSYHTKPFKVHMAVKEMINLSKEIEVIITQKYKKNQDMPDKKRERIKGDCREI